jgi:hypothetical protein
VRSLRSLPAWSASTLEPPRSPPTISEDHAVPGSRKLGTV